MTDSQEFPAIQDFDAQVRAANARIFRREQVAAHRRSLQVCWPEWTPEVGGRCEPCGAIVHNLTHGMPRYHAGAPCKIIECLPDQETFIVEIDYPPGTVAHCFAKNGERLRLDITELWAPVGILHPARYSKPEPESESENEDHTGTAQTPPS